MINNAIYRAALERIIGDLPLKNGRILVTGASGLIGSCLTDMLMMANSNGSNFDVYALGRNQKILSERFKAFKDSPFLHIINQDIRYPLDINLQVDYIVHGASMADPRKYSLYPAETMLTILQGTINMLNYCKTHKHTRLLFLSTFEVYGDNGRDEYSEEDFGMVDMNLLRSCYPESKRSAELLTRCFVEEYGVNAIIARLCSVYGPTMTGDDSKAHAQFIRNALSGKKIVMKSKGSQRRTYCYVMDAVAALVAILAKGENGEVYNISYENSVATIAEVARCVSELAGTDVVYELPDETERLSFSTPQNCILNNEKLRSLGWQGHYGLIEGLIETLDILKDNERITNR